MALFEEVRDTLIEQLAVKPEMVTPDADIIKDLGADSLDAAELLSALEDKYGLEIGESESTQIKTVNELVQLLEHKIALKAKTDT